MTKEEIKEEMALDKLGDILTLIEVTEVFRENAKAMQTQLSYQKAAITRQRNKRLKMLAEKNKTENHTLVMIEGENHYFQIFDDRYKDEPENELNPINEDAGAKRNYYEAIMKMEEYKNLNYKNVELWAYSINPKKYTCIKEYKGKNYYCLRYTIENKNITLNV